MPISLGIGCRVTQLGGLSSLGQVLALNPSLFLLPSQNYLYQTTDTSTPITADGQTVGRATNLGTSGNHWTQATAGSRPLWHTSGGKNWVEFDEIDDFLTIALAGLQTIAMAVRPNAVVSDLDTWVSGDANTVGTLIRLINATTWRSLGGEFYVDGGGTFHINGVATFIFTSNTDHVLRAVSTSAPRNTGVIGRANAASTDRYAHGRLYGLLGFPGTLTAAQAALVDAYLSSLCAVPPL